LGLGHLPVAPGTWASAAAVLVWWLLRSSLPPAAARALLVWLMAVALALGLALGPAAERAYGRGDPRQFVLDELAGQWLTCLLFWWRGSAVTAVAAFVAFRLFDISKPFPIRRLERLAGGWGIMADDLAAAVYAAAALWVLSRVVLNRCIGA